MSAVQPKMSRSKQRSQLLALGSWLGALARTVGPFIPLLLVWHFIVILELWPKQFVPPLTAIPEAFEQLMTRAQLISQVGLTLARVAAASLIGLVLGVLFGVAMVLTKPVYHLLRDLINYLAAIGEIGWLPLFVIWSGFNDRTIVLAIVYTVFFPIFYGTISGIERVPKNLVDSVRTLGGSRLHLIRDVMLPGALPSIITGLRAGVGFGWRTVILAEMLIAQKGLGVILFNGRQFFRVDWIIGGMIVAGVIWLTMDNLILKPWEARTIQRWGLQVRAN